MTTTTKTTTSDAAYAYWLAVLGDRSPETVVQEFDLVHGDLRGFSEWLGEAESAALSAAALPTDEEDALRAAWAPHHDAAARELRDAADRLARGDEPCDDCGGSGEVDHDPSDGGGSTQACHCVSGR